MQIFQFWETNKSSETRKKGVSDDLSFWIPLKRLRSDRLTDDFKCTREDAQFESESKIKSPAAIYKFACHWWNLLSYWSGSDLSQQTLLVRQQCISQYQILDISKWCAWLEMRINHRFSSIWIGTHRTIDHILYGPMAWQRLPSQISMFFESHNLYNVGYY